MLALLAKEVFARMQPVQHTATAVNHTATMLLDIILTRMSRRRSDPDPGQSGGGGAGLWAGAAHTHAYTLAPTYWPVFVPVFGPCF